MNDIIKTNLHQIAPEAIRLLEMLSGGIAHDYNNILTVIIGNLTLARSYPNIDPEVQDIYDDIEKSAYAAKDMTEALLVFSKIGFLLPEKASIAEIIKKLARTLFADQDNRIEISEDENLWSIEFDKISLETVLKNIFKFVQHASDKNLHLKVKIENYTFEFTQWQKIIITDPHLVLLEDKIRELFTPHFSIKKLNYGLGLITAYSIIQKHAGYLDLYSCVESGTSFHIIMPVRA